MVATRFRRVFEVVIDQITILQLQEEINGLNDEEKKQLKLLNEICNMLFSIEDHVNIMNRLPEQSKLTRQRILQ